MIPSVAKVMRIKKHHNKYSCMIELMILLMDLRLSFMNYDRDRSFSMDLVVLPMRYILDILYKKIPFC